MTDLGRLRAGVTAPKSLADPLAGEGRLQLLGLPHMRPLVAFVERLRAEHGEAPYPDPLDGGIEARLLLLLETPGPRIRRTGFVSRDNTSGTAANLFRFLDEAGIPREETLIWNAVPFVIHAPGALNRAPRRAEIAAGHANLEPLLDLLPRLSVAVLAGRAAGEAQAIIERARPGLPVIRMPHPSPTYVCTSPSVPQRIREALRSAASLLRSSG